ncbi:calcineurin-like phosphoesterase family protein [Aminobacter niigataensis]|uniref:Calcineurin-like phosphoesterase family protein n=1 Tax=Aminobacter niigataensis TaxID=83265 RepID=A0ABR6L9L6_9HYPH|nr:metallophosphoesterase [Aminobacter niigataensis]MBB4653316.1 calcineurin-like phosphoesterase family protein [Aminobacter niigataensis]
MSFVTQRYIADMHFGHASIIGNCDRPFASTREMDGEIVRRWNAVVGENDLTYILGDYGRPGKDVHAFRRQFHSLAGRKVLILGNHDLGRDGRVDPEIAKLPWHQPPTHLLEVKDTGRRVILSHYAMRVWPASHHGSVHFYGHSHGRLPGIGLSRDVGVDMPDVAFAPRTFAELTAGWGFSVTAAADEVVA